MSIKHLISPFLFVPSSHRQASSKCTHYDADCEIAPECAFICNRAFGRNNATKKRRTQSHAKKTRRMRNALTPQ